MTTAIHTELETLAKEIFARVAHLNGEIRTFEAYAENYSADVRYTATIGEGNDTRKKNDTVQVYFDTEHQVWRCFKQLNLETI